MDDTPEFSVPAECQFNPEAFELLSVWISNNQPTIQFRGNAWEDPAAWGIVLADIAKMVASQYCQATGNSFDDMMSRVIAGFRAELQSTVDDQSSE